MAAISFGALDAFKGFQFTQSTPSNTWTITHGMGTVTPVVDCWVLVGGIYTRILPASVIATSSNVVTLTFSTAQAGRAFVA